jgi:type I restriction enzyme S subunit
MLAGEAEWQEPRFEIREKQELPDGWEYVALGNSGRWVAGGTPSKSNDQFWNNGTIPWLSPKDMKSERILDTRDHITEAAVSETGLKKLPKETLLFVVRGMILAHTFPVAISSRLLTINQDIRGVKPFKGVLPNYLLRAMQAEASSILFAVRESTHGTRRLESETLKCWPIPIPSLKEQAEIVRRLESLFQMADDIEKRVAAAALRSEKLTQAILAKAFRGELVPTEAELARREGRSFESASDLLARIRSKRTDPKQKQTLRKTSYLRTEDKKWPTKGKRKTRKS